MYRYKVFEQRVVGRGTPDVDVVFDLVFSTGSESRALHMAKVLAAEAINHDYANQHAIIEVEELSIRKVDSNVKCAVHIRVDRVPIHTFFIERNEEVNRFEI